MVYDPRIPERDKCVLGYQLTHWANTKPNDVAFIFHTGEQWSWSEALALTQRAAKAFTDLGVVKGEHVISWQPNNSEAILTWFALNYIGAVYVPVNTAYKGNLLEHIVQLPDAKLMVCHADLAPRLNDIDAGELKDVIVTHGSVTLDKLTTHTAAVLLPGERLSEMPVDVEPWDTQYIIFTSGTTGPSKAVLSSYHLLHGAVGL